MKTIFKSALVAIAALAVGFTSCQQEDGVNTPKGGKSVVLSFTQDELAKVSRAVGDTEATQAVTMTNARVFFTTASGDIMDYLSIQGVASGQGDAAYNATARTVGINKITGGNEVTVEGLPGSVTKVVIVGNHTPAMSKTAGNVSELSIAVADMANFDNIPLAGSASLTATGDENEDTGAAIYEAAVDVYPVAARIEIGEIASDATGSTIEKFTLAGIYVNNFYPTMAIDGKNPGTIVNSTGSADYAGGTAPYTSTNIYDNPTSAQNAVTYNAGSGKVWGYNLLAPTTADAEMAHIVVHLTDVVIAAADGATYAGNQYITIRNFYLSGNPTPLAKLAPGYIYKIEKISFAESNMTGDPERFLIDAVVTATLKGWTASTVTTDFE